VAGSQPSVGQLAKFARLEVLDRLCAERGVERDRPTFVTARWVEDQIAALTVQPVSAQEVLPFG
jgi:hypothetical protein